MIFLQFYAEAQEACDRISDQYADDGFAVGICESYAHGSDIHYLYRTTHDPICPSFEGEDNGNRMKKGVTRQKVY